MMVIEMRQAAKDKAFDILDEIEDLGRKKKMALCELKETLYECFESSDDEDDYEDTEDRYEPIDESAEDQDIDFRNRKSYKYNRNYAMRSAMHDDDDMEDMNMRNSRMYRRRAMRMRRRDRMGRFV